MPINNQEFFNESVTKIYAQGHQSADHGGVCFYRQPDGNGACAIGVCIPDNLYQSKMETTRICPLLNNFPNLREYFAGVNVCLMSKMQDTHDWWDTNAGDFRTYWKQQAEKIALAFDLTMPELEN